MKLRNQRNVQKKKQNPHLNWYTDILMQQVRWIPLHPLSKRNSMCISVTNSQYTNRNRQTPSNQNHHLFPWLNSRLNYIENGSNYSICVDYKNQQPTTIELSKKHYWTKPKRPKKKKKTTTTTFDSIKSILLKNHDRSITLTPSEELERDHC